MCWLTSCATYVLARAGFRCRFIVLHAPGIFSGFYKVVLPFIESLDPNADPIPNPNPNPNPNPIPNPNPSSTLSQRRDRFHPLTRCLHACTQVISPFIDPVTKAKINFITGSAAAQSTALAETFDLATWEETLGGELPFTWDAEAYFAADPHMDAATKEAAVTIKP